MCGLIGIASNGQTDLSPEIVPFMFNHLMQVNDSRGGDSYGFMFIDPSKKGPTSYKVIGTHQATARDDKTWSRGLKRIATAVKNHQPFVVIGHNRRATTGEVSIRNQHPFQMGKLHTDNKWIIGAHNGMLSRHTKVAEALGIKNHYEVDSEVIFRAILKQPDNPLDVIRELDPVCVMSLIYMLGDYSKLHLYRGSNPLSIAEHNGLLFWNSESHPLERIISGVGMDTRVLTRETHHTFDVTTGELGSAVDVKPTYELSHSLRESKDPVQWQGGSGWGDGDAFGWGSSMYDRTPSKSVKGYKKSTPPKRDKYKSDDTLDSKIEMYTNIFELDVGQQRELLPLKKFIADGEDKLDTCVVCGLADPFTGVQSCANAETLLYYDGQAFCGVCYYFTVQYDAEEKLMEARREQYDKKAKDDKEKSK